jgi:DNA repair protein RecO (recombination protein O)
VKVTTPAYVLRRVRWSESSLILTLLSLDFGRISGMAKGALRPKSQFYGQLEMFSCTEFELSRREGREMDTVTGASVLEHNEGIRTDPLAFAFACLFGEWTLAVVTHENEPVRPVFLLMGEVTSRLAAGRDDPWAVVCAGVERLLRFAGHGIETATCTVCGREAGRNPGWSSRSGGVVCDKCPENEQNISPGMLEYFRKAATREFDGVVKTRLWQGGFRQCHDLMREFAESRLERRIGLRSLSVVEEIENADRGQ